MVLYKCSECEYFTENISHYQRHLKSDKHKVNTNKILKLEKTLNKLTIICDKMGIFKFKFNLDK